jgi:hypothetical protein
MASDFPVQLSMKHEAGYEVRYFTLDNAQTVKPGAFVFLNTADNEIEKCGTDPALILGIVLAHGAPGTAAGAVNNSKWLYEGKLPVAVLTPNIILGMCSATTPANSHLSDAVEIAELASGNWAVDVAAVNTRMVVHDIDAVNGIFYVSPLAANLQGDSILS